VSRGKLGRRSAPAYRPPRFHFFWGAFSPLNPSQIGLKNALGADKTINYKATPDWGARARALTGGRGVDVVVEVGGAKTLNQSLDAARVGGAVVVIGVLGGFSVPVMLPVLFSKNLRIFGISIGSREQFEDMCAHIERWKLRPVIDNTFGFAEVPQALRLMDAGGHFGKIAVRF
jgi:NADPH:quinone reductase-like Zn-dependent oxidoreductase